MNECLIDLLWRFGGASFALAISSCILYGLAKLLHPNSSSLLSYAGWVPLLNGLLLVYFSVPIPVVSKGAAPQSSSKMAYYDATEGPLPAMPTESATEAKWTDTLTSLSFAKNGEGIEVATISIFPWIVVVVWLAGLMMILGNWTYRYWIFAHAVNSKVFEAVFLNDEWDVVKQKFGVHSSIELHESEFFGPALCMAPTGYRIVVPANQWGKLSSDERLAILSHELAHFQHGHLRKLLLARVIVLLHWFNPFAWQCLKRIEAAYEWAADDSATQLDTNAGCVLASSLLSFASVESSASPSFASIRGGELKHRIVRMISLSQTKESKMKRYVFAFCAAGIMALSIAKVQLVANESTVSFIAPDDVPLEPPSSENELQADSSTLDAKSNDEAGPLDWRVAFAMLHEKKDVSEMYSNFKMILEAKSVKSLSPIRLDPRLHVLKSIRSSKLVPNGHPFAQDRQIVFQFALDKVRLETELETFVDALFGVGGYRGIVEGIRDDPKGPRIDLVAIVQKQLVGDLFVAIDNFAPSEKMSQRVLVWSKISNAEQTENELKKLFVGEPDTEVGIKGETKLYIAKNAWCAAIIDDYFVIGALDQVSKAIPKR